MTYWLIREDPFSRARRTQERARLLKKDSVGSASRALLYSSTSDFLANPSVLRGAGTAVQQVSKSPGSNEWTTPVEVSENKNYHLFRNNESNAARSPPDIWALPGH